MTKNKFEPGFPWSQSNVLTGGEVQIPSDLFSALSFEPEWIQYWRCMLQCLFLFVSQGLLHCWKMPRYRSPKLVSCIYKSYNIWEECTRRPDLFMQIWVNLICCMFSKYCCNEFLCIMYQSWDVQRCPQGRVLSSWLLFPRDLFVLAQLKNPPERSYILRTTSIFASGRWGKQDPGEQTSRGLRKLKEELVKMAPFPFWQNETLFCDWKFVGYNPVSLSYKMSNLPMTYIINAYVLALGFTENWLTDFPLCKFFLSVVACCVPVTMQLHNFRCSQCFT